MEISAVSKENPLYRQVEDLVLAGEIDQAADILLDFLRVNEIPSTQIPLTLKMLKARANNLARDKSRGIISTEQATVEYNKIIFAMLDTLSGLDVKLPSVPPPAKPVPADKSGQVFEKLMGKKSNLKYISWMQLGLEKSKSICRLVFPKGVGTGFLADDGWLYTNFHVFGNAEIVKQAVAQFNFEKDVSGAPLPPSIYMLDADSWNGNEELDYARVKLVQGTTPVPIAQWGGLTFNPEKPAEGDHVSIIQHPNGDFKQIALNENRVLGVYQHFLHYTTDTMPGSSGSPVFNDEWEVVAIHNSGGNLVFNDAGDKRFTNQAVLIDSILADISNDKSATEPQLKS